MGSPSSATRPALSQAESFAPFNTSPKSLKVPKKREKLKRVTGFSFLPLKAMPKFCCITAAAVLSYPLPAPPSALAEILMRICPCFLQESERSRICMFAS